MHWFLSWYTLVTLPNASYQKWNKQQMQFPSNKMSMVHYKHMGKPYSFSLMVKIFYYGVAHCACCTEVSSVLTLHNEHRYNVYWMQKETIHWSLGVVLSCHCLTRLMEISNWISCSWFYFAVPILSLQFIDGGSRWMDGYVNGWVDGCVDRWLDGCKES